MVGFSTFVLDLRVILRSQDVTPLIRTPVDCMDRKNLALLALVSAFFLISTDSSQLAAANMRSFIEAVRKKATVVYVGSVKEVQILTRTKFDIKARAVVDVSAVVRGRGTNAREAIIEYSSFDDKTPMLEGGPQYQLRPGAKVVALQTPSRAPFLPDISFRAAAKSCCTTSKHSATPSGTCLPTNLRHMRLTRKIVVFSSPCTTSSART